MATSGTGPTQVRTSTAASAATPPVTPMWCTPSTPPVSVSSSWPGTTRAAPRRTAPSCDPSWTQSRSNPNPSVLDLHRHGLPHGRAIHRLSTEPKAVTHAALVLRLAGLDCARSRALVPAALRREQRASGQFAIFVGSWAPRARAAASKSVTAGPVLERLGPPAPARRSDATNDRVAHRACGP